MYKRGTPRLIWLLAAFSVGGPITVILSNKKRNKTRVMSEAKKIRNKFLTIRMTDAEYEELRRLCKKTTCTQLSHYGRSVLLNKPVYVKYRNESLDAF